MTEESLGEMSADNYYLKDVDFNALHESIQMTYVWHKDASSGGAGWSSYYRIILYANQVLASLEEIEGDENEKAFLKGKALFFRGNAFYQLAQLFAEAYDRNTVNEKLGLPLRLLPGISEGSKRVSLQQTYNQVVYDFTNSAELLPGLLFEVPTQPNKAAAFQGLARTYLLMGEYEKALSSALSSLEVYSSLVDYNDIDLSDSNPIPYIYVMVLQNGERWNYANTTWYGLR